MKQKEPSIIIAKNNIVSLYWNSGSKFGITAERVVTITRKDIMQAAAKMERENRAAASMATSSSANSSSLNNRVGPPPPRPPVLTTVSTSSVRFPSLASVSSSMISGQKLGASANSSETKTNLESPSSIRSSLDSSSQAAINETLEGLDAESLFSDF